MKMDQSSHILDCICKYREDFGKKPRYIKVTPEVLNDLKLEIIAMVPCAMTAISLRKGTLKQFCGIKIKAVEPRDA